MALAPKSSSFLIWPFKFPGADSNLPCALSKNSLAFLKYPLALLKSSCRPLNFIGSQLVAFFSPFLSLIFSSEECDSVVRLLERRESIDHLIDAIGRIENEMSRLG